MNNENDENTNNIKDKDNTNNDEYDGNIYRMNFKVRRKKSRMK